MPVPQRAGGRNIRPAYLGISLAVTLIVIACRVAEVEAYVVHIIPIVNRNLARQVQACGESTF